MTSWTLSLFLKIILIFIYLSSDSFEGVATLHHDLPGTVPLTPADSESSFDKLSESLGRGDTVVLTLNKKKSDRASDADESKDGPYKDSGKSSEWRNVPNKKGLSLVISKNEPQKAQGRGIPNFQQKTRPDSSEDKRQYHQIPSHPRNYNPRIKLRRRSHWPRRGQHPQQHWRRDYSNERTSDVEWPIFWIIPKPRQPPRFSPFKHSGQRLVIKKPWYPKPLLNSSSSSSSSEENRKVRPPTPHLRSSSSVEEDLRFNRPQWDYYSYVRYLDWMWNLWKNNSKTESPTSTSPPPTIPTIQPATIATVQPPLEPTTIHTFNITEAESTTEDDSSEESTTEAIKSTTEEESSEESTTEAIESTTEEESSEESTTEAIQSTTEEESSEETTESTTEDDDDDTTESTTEDNEEDATGSTAEDDTSAESTTIPYSQLTAAKDRTEAEIHNITAAIEETTKAEIHNVTAYMETTEQPYKNITSEEADENTTILEKDSTVKSNNTATTTHPKHCDPTVSTKAGQPSENPSNEPVTEPSEDDDDDDDEDDQDCEEDDETTPTSFPTPPK